MKISEMIGMLAMIMAEHGDKDVAFVNDATGEIRYIAGVTVTEGCDEILLDHIDYGEACAVEALAMIAEIVNNR